MVAHLGACKILQVCFNHVHTCPRKRCIMSENGRPVRSWREIADEASRERDPRKLQELARELELAFDARDQKANHNQNLRDGSRTPKPCAIAKRLHQKG